jgi:hypothetical protein
MRRWRAVALGPVPTCSSLQRTPPAGPALPGLGGVDLFLPSLSPEALAEDVADHVFLMVDMGCAHAGTLNRAQGLRRFSKREVRA